MIVFEDGKFQVTTDFKNFVPLSAQDLEKNEPEDNDVETEEESEEDVEVTEDSLEEEESE